MKNKIIINIGLNTFNFDKFFEDRDMVPPRLTKEWIEYRMDIFINYTCKSLLNQVNQDFTAIIYYDPLSTQLVMNALSKYKELPSNIIFVPIDPKYFFTLSNTHILDSYIADYDYLYLVRIDSDDMYHPSFIQQLHDLNIDNSIECILNQNGYIYDIHENSLGLWSYNSPPFYTLVYKVSDYLNGFRYDLSQGHSSAINLNCCILDSRNFMVISHNKNTSTAFNNEFNCGEIIDINEKNNILKEFSIIN